LFAELENDVNKSTGEALLGILESRDRIQQKLFAESNPFILGWSHYLILMRIANPDERRFYEIEAARQQWTYKQLQRQYGSSLHERLALSRDKDAVMKLAKEGQVVEQPRDMLKNPLVLEFLGMDERVEYSESDLENAIIGKLQAFLLELGKGFLFEARQKRFTFNEQHFLVDLVFYNRLLKCYVLIDLKNALLKHQDLGQMQMYVHYFDRYVKTEDERPTVGILLCREKEDSIIELTLPEGENIYASEYSLYLPDKTLLQQKLAEWVAEFEEAQSLQQVADQSQSDPADEGDSA
jgi:predicted nuclease of restriction endonuclease-like (RecB) superfamily